MEEHAILSERLEEQLKAIEWAKAEQERLLKEKGDCHANILSECPENSWLDPSLVSYVTMEIAPHSIACSSLMQRERRYWQSTPWYSIQ